MPPDTLERAAPVLFRQELSVLSRCALYSALSLLLMVTDARWSVTEPLRQVFATLLYPLQWLVLQPVELVQRSLGYVQALHTAQGEASQAQQALADMAVRAGQSDQLARENAQLRALLGLRERLATPAHAAQVLYDTADPYTRRVVIDRGLLAGIQVGSAVMDAHGVLGQVTRVFPMQSEVTLLIDRNQTIPVINIRTGVRSVVYGDPALGHGGGLELRFTATNADIQEGDLLTTSGMDGMFPAGLPVARVQQVERRVDSAFAQVFCVPLAQVEGAHYVMVLQPLTTMAQSPPDGPQATDTEIP